MCNIYVSWKKYLKYKNKYLNLKKQIGGLTIPNITDSTVHNYYKHSKLYNNLQKEKPFESNYSVDPHSSIKTYKDNIEDITLHLSQAIE